MPLARKIISLSESFSRALTPGSTAKSQIGLQNSTMRGMPAKCVPGLSADFAGYAGILVEYADNAHFAKKKEPEHRCPSQYRTSQEQIAILANRL
jgi:hypothetical protein